MSRFNIALCLLAVAICAMPANAAADRKEVSRVLVYGASGRIGGPIVDEALLRGYEVTGVSRNPARLEQIADRINVEAGNILDRERTADLVALHDAVIVSIGGKPANQDPSQYIAALAAESLVDVLAQFGDDGPRLIFVGYPFTLEIEDGKSMLELERVPDTHENYAMFYGHQIALDTFRQSQGVNWTVASPPNGLRLEGRTGEVRWGGDVLLRDPDGVPSGISLEDFAYAVFEELENGNYIRQRFNVAR
jgi:putative NADH-flavin reductase